MVYKKHSGYVQNKKKAKNKKKDTELRRRRKNGLTFCGDKLEI